MKKCPYCAEEIQDAAIVCRYCKRDLPPNEKRSVSVEKPLNDKNEIDARKKTYTDRQIVEGLAEKFRNEEATLTTLKMAKLSTARDDAEKTMNWGLLFFIGGVVFTFLSYNNAESGGTFIVAVGAIFWGLIRIVIGWNMKRKANKIFQNIKGWERGKMKTCPYCAEEIQDAAIVCRYCGRDLVDDKKNVHPKNETVSAIPPGEEKKTGFFQNNAVKASLVLTVLSLIAKGLNNSFGDEFFMSLIFSAIGAFILWYLITSIVIWLIIK